MCPDFRPQLGKLCFDRGDYPRLTRILKQLHLSCQTEQGDDDMKKGTQLLEVYALEIQMYTEQKNSKKLKALYEQSLHIKSAIPHPLIMGVIRGECSLAGCVIWVWFVQSMYNVLVDGKCNLLRVDVDVIDVDVVSEEGVV